MESMFMTPLLNLKENRNCFKSDVATDIKTVFFYEKNQNLKS